MAKKLKMMSLFQELQGRAQVTNRRPAQPSAAIYLMQLRAQNGATALPRRRLVISVDLNTIQPGPHPVKINHRGNTDSNPPSPGSDDTRVTVNATRVRVPQVRSDVG
jgi:hypothetical protein